MGIKEEGPRFAAYRKLLMHYLAADAEPLEAETARQISMQLHRSGVLPADLVAMHIRALKEAVIPSDPVVLHSLDFLMKVMSGYGQTYKEHQRLKNRQQQLDKEIDVAAEVQKALLEGKVPPCSFADIGAVSEPAKKMSGDYYRIVNDGRQLAVTIADIVGKGIPAAMCMSMIKYAMDSLPENSQGAPSYILSNLNRVVARNVDESMFITMFYGVYDPETRIFSNASAGHEPGFYYSARRDCFEDMEARGMALGLAAGSTYTEYARGIEPGDMIFLLTDGVTEIRGAHGFIDREQIVRMIRRFMHLPAPQITRLMMHELKKIQQFSLHDDLTFIAMKF